MSSSVRPSDGWSEDWMVCHHVIFMRQEDRLKLSELLFFITDGRQNNLCRGHFVLRKEEIFHCQLAVYRSLLPGLAAQAGLAV